MFLKKQKVHKQGHVYTYYRIVESYRDEQGKNKHRTVKYLGKLSDEEVSAITEQLKENRYPFSNPNDVSIPEHKQHTHILSRKVWIPLSLTIITYLHHHPKEWTVAEYDTLMMIKEGQADVQLQGSHFTIKADQVLFCPAGSGVFLYNNSSQPVQLLKLMFQNVDKHASSSWSSDGLATIIPVHSPLEMQRLGKELLATVDQPKELSVEKELYSQLLFYQLLHLIWNHQSPGTEATNLNMIQQATDEVRVYYREEIRRTVIAARLGITPEHFSRIFRKHKGISFTDYVYRWRMNAAKKDLQYSSASISEIARRNGYPNEHYFSRRFKSLFGLSPKQYQSSEKQYAAWNYPFTSMLLQLGIVPQAGYLEQWKWEKYHQHLDLSTMIVLHDSLEQSIQTMNDVQPDLVFAYEDNLGRFILEEYVPVQTLSIEHHNWQQQWLWLAEQVGRLEQAHQWLNDWDRQIQQAREQLSSFIGMDETVGIYKIVSEKIYVYGDRRSMGGPLIYQQLHHIPPAIVQEDIIDQNLISKEVTLAELSRYAADHMIVIYYPVEGTSEVALEPVMESLEWQQLAAVQNRQCYTMDRNIFYGFDPCSQEAQLKLWLQQFIS